MGQRPRPGQVAKRVIEGFTERKLSDRWAFPVSTAMHWAYGSGAAALYGIAAGSMRSPHAAYGLPFGAVVWAAGYVILPEGGLYKPIWDYDAKTLVWDLSGHLAHGAGTGVTFWLLGQGLGLAVAAADRFHLPNLEVIEVDENITSNNSARMPAVATRKPDGLGQPVQDTIWQPTYPDSVS